MGQITLSRKDLVLKLGEGGDEGMIHSVLTGLPEFVDYGQGQDNAQNNTSPELAKATPEHSNCIPQPNEVVHSPPAYPIAEPKKLEDALETDDLDLRAPMDGPASESSSPDTLMTLVGGAGVLGGSVHSTPHDEDTSVTSSSSPSSSPQQAAPSTFLDPADVPLPPSAPPTRPASPVHPRPTPGPSLSLSSVLLLADELSTRFPPSTPELRLAHTLGPASAMRTWAQDASLMPSDSQAEAFVISGADIVVREDPEPDPRTLKELKAQRRRKRKARKEARVLAVGAVLVLGVAVVYGVRARHGGAGAGAGIIGTETQWRALVGALGALGDRVLGAFGDAHIDL
jgi:hypothetical protein